MAKSLSGWAAQNRTAILNGDTALESSYSNDSKVVYKPSGGLADLEFGLLSALAWVGRRPRSWREVWAALDAAPV